MITEPMTFEIVPAELGLELAAKTSLELAFTGFFEQARKWQSAAESITDPKEARSARLEIKGLRVSAEKTRKQLKEDSLRMGKAIDGANNILLALIVPIEQKLDDIEKAEERAAAARIQALQEERAETLASMGHDSYGINLGMMSDDAWAVYLQQAKDVYEFRQEQEKRRIAAAEEEARRQAEEREAQRLENIRLREEAEKAAAELAKERAEQAKRDATAKADRDAMEAKTREDARKASEAAENARKAAAAELAKEQAEKALIEAEARALRDAEAKRIADEKAAADAKAKADALAAKKAAAAPDKAKMMEFATKIRDMEIPMVKSEAAAIVRNDIAAKLESFAKWIETQASTL